jgi:TonB family protein
MKSEVKEPERPAVVMLESPESEDPEHPDTGTALVTVQADSLGRVWSVRLARSSGFARLDSIALQTARQQKLGPRAQSGKRMPFTLQQFYQFRPGKKAQQKSDN